ncbi:MAG: FapA family protein [Candidatus Cloacimonadota bacterium]
MTDVYESPSGFVKLEIREGGMSAWLTIHSHTGLVNETEILELIDRAGIKSGFEDAQRYIREQNLEKDFDSAFPLAMCQSSAAGTKLNYYFDIHKNRRLSPSPDPALLPNLEYVEAGTIVADYSSNLFDRQGSIYNIFGEIIANPEIDPGVSDNLAGSGISFDPQRNAFVAAKTGYPYIDEEDKICLLDSIILGTELRDYSYPLHIPVDMVYQGDLENAEIYCRGAMQINGSVKSSLLHTGNDLEISGELTESQVRCEGNLRLGTIRKCSQPVLVLGNLNCQSIIESSVLCQGKIELSRLIDRSVVVTDGGLSGSFESCIQDSHLQACASIEAGNLGRVDGDANELEITISPFNKAILTRLTKELIRYKEQGNGAGEEAQKIQDEIKACEQQLDQQLNKFLRRSREERYRIRIHGDVHPPTEIRILKHSYSITSYQNSLLLEEKD